MFDLDAIEKDWLENSFRLSEEEIIKIFQKEGATLSAYEKEIDEYIKKGNSFFPSLTAEERILQSIFGPTEEQKLAKEKFNKYIEETPNPTKKHLSKESQKIVVEGCLYIVFEATREWYQYFNGKLTMEKIYYICLEALLHSVKYVVHNEKPFFTAYVLKSIERNIICYIAKVTHAKYREIYPIIHSYNISVPKKENRLNLLIEEEKEIPTKTSEIYSLLNQNYYEINFIGNIVSEDFQKEYENSLNKLDRLAKIIMQLSFDENGYRNLTIQEIADITSVMAGIEKKQVIAIRKRAIQFLRQDIKREMY